MLRTKNNGFEVQDKSRSENLIAKRVLNRALIGMLVFFGAVIMLMVISNYAQAGDWGVEVRHNIPTNGIADVEPAVDFDYSIDIINTGDLNPGEDINMTVTLDSASQAAGWTVTPDGLTLVPGVEMGDGNKVTETITVRAPSDALFEDTAYISVEVEVREHEGETGCQDSLQLRANVIQVFGVLTTVKDGDNQHDVNDGDITVFNITVENTGNGDDTFDMSYTGLPAGWDPPTFGMDSIPIVPGANVTTTFQINVPINAESNYYSTIRAVATSQGSASKTSSASVTVHVLAKYKVTVSGSPTTTSKNPGETADYLITVNNKGNIEEDFTITYEVLEGESWSMTLSNEHPLIGFQENITVTLSVTIDGDALDAHYSKIRVKASSDTDPTKNQSVTLTLNVNQIFGVSVPSPTPQDADPGDTLWFIVSVRNTGNGEDTFNIETSGAFSGGTPNTTLLSDMQPDEIRTINVTVNVDDNAPAGIQDITITAISEGDPSTSNSGTVQVDVQERYEIFLFANTAKTLWGYPDGDPVQFEVRIKNDGTGMDDITLNFENENPDLTVTLEPSFVNNLDPDAFTIAYLNVTIPTGEIPGFWDINVTGTSNGDPAVTSTVTFTVQVKAVYNLTLSCSPNSKSTPGDSSITYNVVVKNRGTTYDDFTVDYYAEDSTATTWPSVSPAAFGIASNENKTVILTVVVPRTAVPGQYNIWVNVSSDNDTAVTRSIKTVTDVTQSYEVIILTGQEMSGEASPDEMISYMVTVHNSGTGPDDLLVQRQDSVSNHPTWASASINFIEDLAAGTSYNIWINISMPSPQEVGGDTEDYVKYLIISQGDQSVPPTQTYVWLNTTITPVRDAKLTPEQDIYYREPGDVITVTIQLTNTGTATDILTLEDVSLVPYDTWGVVKLPATVTLGPDNSTNMSYIVTVYEEVTRAESPVKLNLVVKSDGADDEVVDAVNITIYINQTFGVDIFTIQPELEGDPGETVPFEIEVQNLGNDEDRIKLSYQGTEVGTWSTTKVILQPEESRIVYFNITIDPEHDTSDITMILKATSEGDDTVNMTLEIILNVNPSYEIFLTSNGPNQDDVVGGENVTFSLSISNWGTAVDKYHLIAGGNYSFWATINPSNPTNTTVIVDSDETGYIDIMVSPPEDVLRGIYEIIINVTSLNDNTVTAEFTFRANVIATYDVFLSAPTSTQRVDAGQTATFIGILVENRGNDVDEYQFFVTSLPSGWSYTQPSNLQVQEGIVGSFDLSVSTSSGSASGLYRFNLTARSVYADTIVESTVELIVEVEQVYIVDLPGFISSEYVDVGETVSYLIEVTNDGNGLDNIEVKLTGDLQYGFLYYAGQYDKTIEVSPSPGGSLYVYLNVTPTLNYWDVETSETIQITIEAKSLLDPETPLVHSLDVNTNVNHAFGFSLATGGSRSGLPGETVTFSLTINNDASQGDQFYLDIRSITTTTGGTIWYWENANTAPFSSNPATINTGTGKATIDVDINIPDPTDISEVPPGEYIIEIEVESEGDSDIVKTTNVTVIVDELYKAWITDSVKLKKANIGTSVSYDLNIENQGNTPDNITIVVEDDEDITGSANWANITYGGQEILSGERILLNPFVTETIVLTVNIPERDDPEYPSPDPTSVSLNVKVIPSSSDEEDDDELLVTTNIEPIFEFGLSSTSPQNTKEADAGDQITFTLRIDNTGTVPDSYNLQASNYDEAIFSIATINDINNIGAKGYGTTPVDITIDPDADLGSYPIEITAESDGDSSIKEIITLTIDITGPIYEFELTTTAPLNKKEADAADQIQFTLQVRNTGTDPDTYDFLASSYDENVFIIGTINSISVNEDSNGQTTVTITIDEDADLGSYQIEIAAESQADSSVKQTINLTVDITGPIYLFTLESTSPQETKEAEPGDIISFTLVVTNIGTADDTYTLDFVEWDTDVFPSPTVNDIDIAIAPDESHQPTASITIIDDETKAVVRDPNDPWILIVNVKSVNDPSVSDNITLIIDMQPVGVVEFTDPIITDNGEPGDVLDYRFEISNIGNDDDIYDLALTGEYKNWGEIYDRTGTTRINEISLNVSDNVQVIVRVTIPGAGETSANDVYTIFLEATSRNTAGIKATAQAQTTVEEYVDLTLAYSGTGEATLDYDPNEKDTNPARFRFRVTNNGNIEETAITVEISGMPSWNPPTIEAIDPLLPGKSYTFTITFNIQYDKREAEYPMQIYVISTDSKFDSEPVDIVVNIIKPDLVVTEVVFEDSDTLKEKVGDSTSVTATISNDGNADANNIEIKLIVDGIQEDKKSVSSLPAGGSRDVRLVWDLEDEKVNVRVEITEQYEDDVSNNEGSEYSMDLRADLSFEGVGLNFSKSNPDPGDEITITAYITNDGGNYENVIVMFYSGTTLIGTDTVDVDYGRTKEARWQNWKVPDKPGESLDIKAELIAPGAQGDEDDFSKSLEIAEEGGGPGDLFSAAGLMGMGIGFILGAIILLIVGLMVGRSMGAKAARTKAARATGAAPPAFAAMEKQMPEGADKKAPKGPAAGPAPFERTEEGPEEEEKGKPKEGVKVRCPKCGKVTEVTSTQRPLQIPCECGTTLMLKK